MDDSASHAGQGLPELLEGKALNAAVALALGYTHHGAVGLFSENKDGKPWCLSEVNDWWKTPEGEWLCGPCHGFPNNYAGEWEHGGPIIEREHIELHCLSRGGKFMGEWFARITPIPLSTGPTPLVAAMRAFVASRADTKREPESEDE